MTSLFAKYLPTSVATMTFASPVLAKVAKEMASGSLHDHLLLHGLPGTGKSHLARLIVSDWRPGVKLKSITYEGADWDSGTQGSILGQLNMDSAKWDQHYTLINEVDEISPNELRRLKSFMDRHLAMKFVMTTNYPQRLSPAFLNRCNPHLLDMTPADSVASIVQSVFEDRGYQIPSTDALALVSACAGSWRTLEALVRQQLP